MARVQLKWRPSAGAVKSISPAEKKAASTRWTPPSLSFHRNPSPLMYTQRCLKLHTPTFPRRLGRTKTGEESGGESLNSHRGIRGWLRIAGSSEMHTLVGWDRNWNARWGSCCSIHACKGNRVEGGNNWRGGRGIGKCRKDTLDLSCISWLCPKRFVAHGWNKRNNWSLSYIELTHGLEPAVNELWRLEHTWRKGSGSICNSSRVVYG